MIYTVTFNPAIDYVMHIDSLAPGKTNRSDTEEIYFGGKGINVSAVLKELGLESVALGFAAGFTGRALAEGIEKMGIRSDFVMLKNGNTRINVKIKSLEETEINGQGPDIGEEDVGELFKRLNTASAGDCVVLAGSIPRTLPNDIYEKILAFTAERKVRAAVDASGQLLIKALKYKPFVVKPNNFELEEILGSELKNDDEIITGAMELKKMGAVNVLVSMAEKGAILVDEFWKVHRCGVCRGKVKNSVGAGDSMLAGFIAGSLSGDYEYALKLGTAAGGATAFSDGLAEKRLIEEMLQQL